VLVWQLVKGGLHDFLMTIPSLFLKIQLLIKIGIDAFDGFSASLVIHKAYQVIIGKNCLNYGLSEIYRAAP